MPPLILFPIKPPLLIYVGQEWPVLFEQAKEPGGPRAALQPEHHRGGHVARGGREEPEEEVGGGAGVDGDEPGVGGEEGEGSRCAALGPAQRWARAFVHARRRRRLGVRRVAASRLACKLGSRG